VTVPLNDNIDYEGGVVTWIDTSPANGRFGNDLDPTLNLDILEVSFRNLARWKIIETPTAARYRSPHHRLSKTPGRKRRVYRSRSHIYYLPELYLRLFRPLLRRVHRAAAGGAAGDRP